MRFIHTSDWHLGRTLHGADLLEHQRAFLRWLLALARERGVDAVLVAGDVFDRAVPGVEPLALLDEALRDFAAAGIPLVVTSGNHDSAVRLGTRGDLIARAGIHLRTRVEDLTTPVLLADEHGVVGVYGIPYLVPDTLTAAWGAARSHEAVLKEATARILADADARGLDRLVAVAHAFVTGGEASGSERDIRVGGEAEAPAAVFGGFGYVALGHLHRPQPVGSGDPAAGPVLRYSGSPLAYSFGERAHAKSVTIVEMDAAGAVRWETVPTPVPRPLVELTGRLEELLARTPADAALVDATLTDAVLADAWIKVVLTDPVRPHAPMERLRERWPGVLVLDFQPEGGLGDAAADIQALAETTDPLALCQSFVDFVTGGPPSEDETLLLQEAVEAALAAEGVLS